MTLLKGVVIAAVIVGSVWAYTKYQSLVWGADGDKQE